MDKKTKWSGAAVVALIAGAANAGDHGEFQITPYLGHANVKVDGQYLERGSSESYTQWLVGISAGYRAPFGLVVEIGTAAAGEPILGWAVGGEVRETYGAVGSRAQRLTSRCRSSGRSWLPVLQAAPRRPSAPRRGIAQR